MKGWYNLKKTPKKKGYESISKVRVEICCYFSNVKAKQVSSTSSQNNEKKKMIISIMGWKRGKCIIPGCNCSQYHPTSGKKGGYCKSCAHWPSQHQNKGKSDPSSTPLSEDIIDKKSHLRRRQTIKEMQTSFSSYDLFNPSFIWEIDPSEITFKRLCQKNVYYDQYEATYRNNTVYLYIYHHIPPPPVVVPLTLSTSENIPLNPPKEDPLLQSLISSLDSFFSSFFFFFQIFYYIN